MYGLDDAIDQLHGLMAAAHNKLLHAIAEYDISEEWRDDGATSMADWLQMRRGIPARTALEWVRVAHALSELPAIDRAFFESDLCWEKVRWLVRFATPETDAELAREAPGLTPAQVRARALLEERITAREAAEADRKRRLRLRWDPDDALRLSGWFPADQGAVIATAIRRISDQAGPDPASGLYPCGEERYADALFQIASTRLGADTDPDRATVVVHADAPMLAGGDGIAALDNGSRLAVEVVQRLICDGRLQTVVHAADGTPIGMGRTARTVPSPLLRQVRRRDVCCRFPGCSRTWTHAHHKTPWSQGGPTDYDNVFLLCPIHHRLVHEHYWTVTGDVDGILSFRRPDGRVLPERPPPARAEITQRFFTPVDAPHPDIEPDDTS
jgi:hypothetical protein